MSEDRALEKVYGKTTYQELELRLRTGEQAFATQAATITDLRAKLADYQQEMMRVKADAIQGIAKLAEAEREIARLESLREMEGAALVNGAAMVEAASKRADSAESRLAAIAERVRDWQITESPYLLAQDILRLAEGDQ